MIRGRFVQRLAIAVGAGALLLAIATLWLLLETERSLGGQDSVGAAVLAASFGAVGALIAGKRPNNKIGWIFAVSGFFNGINAASPHYAEFAAGSSLPGTPVAAWMSLWVWGIGAAGFPLLLLLFPTGRPLSRRWVPVLWLVAIGAVAAVLPVALTTLSKMAAPEMTFALVPEQAAEIMDYGIMLLGVSILAGVVAVALRFRRAVGAERQQMKWLFYGGSLTLVVLILASPAAPFRLSGPVAELSVLVLPSIPIATAVAIFKYRLYDIDVIINRTLVYGALTGVLVGAYALGVLVFRTVLDPVTPDNDLAIAASTLAVAALFGPARRKIQAFIDRRFYRSRYDAQQTLERFAARLRDEVDLDAVSNELVHVVSAAVHPHHASVWLVDGAER